MYETVAAMGAHTWRRMLDGVLEAEPLFAAEASDGGLNAPGPAPRAVYMGLGLCTRHRMAAGLPLDVLGMLLPAERVRAAVGARHLVVLVADAHARSNGFVEEDVDRRSRAVIRALLRIRCARQWHRLTVIRASVLHREPGYCAALERIRANAGGEGNEYIYRQTADVAFLDEFLGGIVKVGWTVDPQGTGGGYQDEVAFDRRVGPWSGRRPRYAYVACARAFDDRRPKVSPYVGVERARRIYLDPRESIGAKLARAPHLASKRNVASARRHLSLIADAWGADGSSLETRLRSIFRELYPSRGEQFCSSLPARAQMAAGDLAVETPRTGS